MTVFFGARWDAPALHDAEHAPTPVGQCCVYCGDSVEHGDRGFLQPCLDLVDGKLVGTARAVHAECALSSVMGHIVGVCSCTGYEPGRAASRLVWQRVYGRQ